MPEAEAASNTSRSSTTRGPSTSTTLEEASTSAVADEAPIMIGGTTVYVPPVTLTTTALPTAAPPTVAPRCPLQCQWPYCVDGDATDGGQKIYNEQNSVINRCAYRCSKPYDVYGTQQRYCGAGPEYEGNETLDCSECFRDRPPGPCLVYGAYWEPMGRKVIAASYEDCQNLCFGDAYCETFSFWADHGCFLQGAASNPDLRAGPALCEAWLKEHNVTCDEAAESVVSGPRACGARYFGMYPDLASATKSSTLLPAPVAPAAGAKAGGGEEGGPAPPAPAPAPSAVTVDFQVLGVDYPRLVGNEGITNSFKRAVQGAIFEHAGGKEVVRDVTVQVLPAPATTTKVEATVLPKELSDLPKVEAALAPGTGLTAKLEAALAEVPGINSVNLGPVKVTGLQDRETVVEKKAKLGEGKEKGGFAWGWLIAVFVLIGLIGVAIAAYLILGSNKKEKRKKNTRGAKLQSGSRQQAAPTGTEEESQSLIAKDERASVDAGSIPPGPQPMWMQAAQAWQAPAVAPVTTALYPVGYVWPMWPQQQQPQQLVQYRMPALYQYRVSTGPAYMPLAEESI